MINLHPASRTAWRPSIIVRSYRVPRIEKDVAYYDKKKLCVICLDTTIAQ